MKKCLLVSFLCVFFAAHFLYAINFTEAEQKKIREYHQSIVNRIAKHDVKNLIKDEYFLQTLTTELKNKTRKPEDKVYFFYLMMQKIGWAFCGGISMPPSFTYADYSLMQIETLYDYREKLSSLGIDSKPFFNLTFKDIDTKPILASYAFLLGALLEPDANVIFDICNDAYDNGFLKIPTLFRAMFIHNMMLVSPAMTFATEKQNPDEYSDFMLLTQEIFKHCDCKEEEKEDLIISIIYDDNYDPCITPRIIDEKNSADDFFVLTCAILIERRLNSKESFMEFIDLWETHEKEDWKKKIIAQIKDNDYEVEYHKLPNIDGYSYTKTWDDVSIVLYDNGKLFEYDGYSEFIPNNNP